MTTVTDDGLWASDLGTMLDRQARVLELIAAAAPLPDVLTEILTSLEQLIEGGRCSVLLLDRGRGTLHHGAAPGLPAAYVDSIDGMTIGDGAGSCGTAAALNRPVVAADVRTDPRWARFRTVADAVGLRSCWSTPIRGRDGRPVGTFAVYHDQPHRPSRREQLLVDRSTHLASVAIDHARLLGDLVESEDRFRTSFHDNALGMAILGSDRAVVTCNRALVDLIGVEGGGGPTGRRLDDLVVPQDRTLQAWLDDLGHDAVTITFEAAMRGARGRGPGVEVEVEVTASRLRGRDGGPGQYVVNVLDLTERRAAEDDRRALLEAETARRTAEELAHARSEVLAAVGHEARTPIQAIVGFTELLGTLDLDEARRREALHHIDAAAGHVMDLLTDVLDLSRIEANVLPLALGPVRVGETVSDVLGLLGATAARRRVTLAHELTDEVVRADPRRLRQVLLNLVGNAVRHGRWSGRVVVRPLPVTSPDDRDLWVSVDDDGPGIPAELRPRVFTPFARARHTGAPHHGDLAEDCIGLGLGLAHGLAAAMGGELVVRRSGPSGTSMALRLPRLPPGAGPTHDEPHDPRADPGAGPPETKDDR